MGEDVDTFFFSKAEVSACLFIFLVITITIFQLGFTIVYWKWNFKCFEVKSNISAGLNAFEVKSVIVSKSIQVNMLDSKILLSEFQVVSIDVAVVPVIQLNSSFN